MDEVTTGSYYHVRNSTAARNVTTYDVLGRTLSVTAPDSTNTSFIYSDGYTGGAPYTLTTLTDPNGNATSTHSDLWGRVA